MNVQQNFDLKPFNTFGLPVKAKYWLELNDAPRLEIRTCVTPSALDRKSVV